VRRSLRRSLQTPLGYALLAWCMAGCTIGLPRDPPKGAAEQATRARALPSPSQPSDLTDLVTHLADDGSLVAGLTHVDPAIRRVAARGLSRLPEPEDLKQVLLRASVEPDADVLAELCFAFGRWEDPEAGAPLRKLALHPSSSVRAAALSALGRLRDDRETDLLVRALADTNSTVRQAAALALADLDGRRFDHPRKASTATLTRRDEALAQALHDDPDQGVRWRAAYTLASILPRAAHEAPLRQALTESADDPVTLAFALRGLAALHDEGLADALEAARQFMGHSDQRVVMEAVAILGAHGPYQEVAELAFEHSNPAVRTAAWSSVAAARARERALRASETGAPQWPGTLADLDQRLQVQLQVELEPSVKRAALTALAHIDDALAETLGASWRESLPATSELPEIEQTRTGLALLSVQQLALSSDPRDRARAGELIASGIAQDGDLIIALLDDPDPRVQASVLPLLGDDRYASLRPRLEDALKSGDPALMSQAAKAAAPLIESGLAPPWLVSSVADALEGAQSFVLEETRIELAAALGLPPLDGPQHVSPSTSPLLQLLMEQEVETSKDSHPLVRMETSRGVVVLRLERTLAPVHVASFLELAEAGFYDGLDFHRVVPNFVVQGLDPRGDGWGVGGRRVPDEQSSRPFVTGTVGMPSAGQPHTGGCQIFITLLPTPHLNGNYTVFGQVVQGLDVVESLLIGDRVLSVRLTDDDPADQPG